MMLSSSTEEQLENERKKRRMSERRRVGKEEEEVVELDAGGALRERHRSSLGEAGTVVKRYPNQGRNDGAKWSDTRSNHRIGPWTLVFSDPFQGLLQERLRWTLEQLSQRILFTDPWRVCNKDRSRLKVVMESLLGAQRQMDD
ncbi:unnamed protein product [Fusarium graminearum]|uniref:Chromosome 1, complete genome n=2 Tax=Gibberella zeae TaxID=5518 RepID=I1RD57_GIBZE|nr:hypothetical protein FGSG_01546 [Fusarium graminearum PH-1]EYB22613.1 hypothetical protein FG05_01546 [Fusarium graminearum]ESU06872.1 hypothetical protein FGSG_01546 [Fusarium graminearum PH-1]CAF3467131.1 unnamed protein product [Fusarium graminearum]CAF3599961.1 unnamed protein product [Fusarium graminearum]CAG1983716.1 unnamed protein product [Fusarium graminearum]|eukprot:XP_011317357.1 hypothetical protein FGSG_01546 [Fusarium graminearum PH-1]